MYIVVQGQVIMLVALSRGSCKIVLFFCVEIVQLFVVTMILCFFSSLMNLFKVVQEDRGVGLREDRVQERKRRGVS